MLSRIRKAQEDEGFTLIELLVVIMIIGILSAIAVPTFLGQRTKGYEKAAMAQLASMAIAQESLKTETGLYVAVADTDGKLKENGYAASTDVTLKGDMTSAGASYLICAAHKKGGRMFKITPGATSPIEVAANSTEASTCA